MSWWAGVSRKCLIAKSRNIMVPKDVCCWLPVFWTDLTEVPSCVFFFFLATNYTEDLEQLQIDFIPRRRYTKHQLRQSRYAQSIVESELAVTQSEPLSNSWSNCFGPVPSGAPLAAVVVTSPNELSWRWKNTAGFSNKHEDEKWNFSEERQERNCEHMRWFSMDGTRFVRVKKK